MGNRKPIGVKLDPDQIERLDAFGETLVGKPSRTSLIEQAIDEFLDRHAEERPAKRRRPER
jgi:predicted transcriptional regulator